MPTLQADAAVAVECYTRSGATYTLTSDPVERLRAYEQADVVDSISLEVWPDEVALTDATAETAPIEQYRRFERWATREEVSLRPAFTVRERTTLVSDRSETVLVCPVLCLAVSVGGELTTVVPHRTETTVVTVDDALTTLEARAQNRSTHDRPQHVT